MIWLSSFLQNTEAFETSTVWKALGKLKWSTAMSYEESFVNILCMTQCGQAT